MSESAEGAIVSALRKHVGKNANVICLIDPDTAKDFDDALSFRREPDGIRAWAHATR